MSEPQFFPHEPIEGGVRRRWQIASVSKYETQVVVERWRDGRIVIVERNEAGSTLSRSISLSDEEARVIRDEIDRALAAGSKAAANGLTELRDTAAEDIATVSALSKREG